METVCICDAYVSEIREAKQRAVAFRRIPRQEESPCCPLTLPSSSSLYDNNVILEQSNHDIQLSGLLAIAIQSDSAVLGETEIVTADHFSQDPRIANVKYRALSIGPLARALLYLSA